MASIIDHCNKLLRDQPCKVLGWALGGIVGAGVTVAAFVLLQGVAIARMALETDIEQRGTAAALAAQIELERENQRQVMTALDGLNEKVGDLSQDISHVKGRLGLPRSASGSEQASFTARPELP